MTDTKGHRGLWCSSSGFLDKQGNCRNPDGCACDVIARLERERDEARAKGEATARLALSLEVEADERIAVAETEASTLRACVEKTSSMVRELLAIHEAHHNHPSHAAARRLLAALTEETAS